MMIIKEELLKRLEAKRAKINERRKFVEGEQSMVEEFREVIEFASETLKRQEGVLDRKAAKCDQLEDELEYVVGKVVTAYDEDDPTIQKILKFSKLNTKPHKGIVVDK